MNNLAVSAWRDIKNSNSYGGSISYSGQLNDRSILKGYTTSLNWSNGQGFSNSFNYSLSDQFVKDMNQNVRDPFIDFMTSMTKNAKDVAFGAAAYVTGLFKDEEKELQEKSRKLSKKNLRYKFNEIKEIDEQIKIAKSDLIGLGLAHDTSGSMNDGPSVEAEHLNLKKDSNN
jgi:hypothetical protein